MVLLGDLKLEGVMSAGTSRRKDGWLCLASELTWAGTSHVAKRSTAGPATPEEKSSSTAQLAVAAQCPEAKSLANRSTIGSEDWPVLVVKRFCLAVGGDAGKSIYCRARRFLCSSSLSQVSGTVLKQSDHNSHIMRNTMSETACSVNSVPEAQLSKEKGN